MLTSNIFRVNFLRPGSTVIDQMVAKMTARQAEIGGGALYSFELPDEAWRFLGENGSGNDEWTSRMGLKPYGTSSLQINDPVGSWGGRTATGSGVGFRAFDGGPAGGNVGLLYAAGAQNNAVWDQASDRMYYISASTGSEDVKQGLASYDAARDEFLHWTAGGTRGTNNYLSLFPQYGGPHNFGTSAWDGQRRRLYKLMRIAYVTDFLSPEQIAIQKKTPETYSNGVMIDDGYSNLYWWVCRFDLGSIQSYETEAAWLAGKSGWMSRYPNTVQAPGSGRIDVTGARRISAWPETIFVPTVGDEGTIFVIQTDDNSVDLWDCASKTWVLRENGQFNFDILKVGHDPSQTVRPGATLIYAQGYVWALGHATGNTGASGGSNYAGTPQLWRFRPTAAGLGTPTIMADPPAHMSLAGYEWPGHHTEMCAIGNRIYCFHGDSWESMDSRWTAIDTSGGVYAYTIDPSGGQGTWTSTRLSTSWTEKLRTMGKHLGQIGVRTADAKGPHDFTVTEIPGRNVFLMAAQMATDASAAWLWKPPL